MNFAWTVSLICCGLCLVTSFKQRIPARNSYDPGSCNNTNHGQEVLVKDKADVEVILICVKDKGVYHWRPTYGTKNTVGEFFNPGKDCTDILNKHEDAKDGTYWIASTSSTPRKVWCDMDTDGGGFMLIGRINSSKTWKVPSNNVTVEPYGEPHWLSTLGDVPIMDFRIQMATREDFKATKAHWSYRLQSKRPLKNLMMNTAGCNQRLAGIGNIAYVKDILTEKIVTTKLQCSKFGYAWPSTTNFGWNKMNSCLQKACPWGFAYLDIAPQQVDFYGGFSFSTTGNISGMEYKSTAFLGCDNGFCCGCYGPLGGTQDYCAENCKAINGGTVTKNVFTWFWVRSSLPKRLWEKCMDYEVKREDGKLISYKLVGDSVVPIEGRCSKDSTLLHDGIVVVPDSSTAQKVPSVNGLLLFRKDKQKLYLRSNKTWNVLAQEEKINQEINQLKILMKKQTSQLLSRRSACFGYKWLTESTRNQKYSGGTACDNNLSTGWYRFGGGAGTKLLTTCVPKNICGTDATGWMHGAHPTVAEGKVTRKVCYSLRGNCCWRSNNIEVVNCGQYYVYKLSPTRGCYLRYCGSD